MIRVFRKIGISRSPGSSSLVSVSGVMVDGLLESVGFGWGVWFKLDRCSSLSGISVVVPGLLALVS